MFYPYFLNSQSCLKEINYFQNKFNIPNDFLYAIALTESGRFYKDEFIPWAWTVNIKGSGKFFSNKSDLDKFINNQKNNTQNIDIGCMQINYFYHGEDFKDTKTMSIPKKNVEKFNKDITAFLTQEDSIRVLSEPVSIEEFGDIKLPPSFMNVFKKYIKE